MFRTCHLAVFIGLLLGAALQVRGQNNLNKFSSEIQSLSPGQPARVIVQFNTSDVATHKLLIEGHGGHHHRGFASSKSSLGTLTRDQLTSLANDPAVRYISPDRPLQSTAVGGLDYAREASGAVAAHTQGWTGAGVGVVVIDSGLTSNTCDWGNSVCQNWRLAQQVSFVNSASGSWSGSDTGYDSFGHGTLVGSIIGGGGAFSTLAYTIAWPLIPSYTFLGVAPGAHLLSYRVLDQNGRGSDSSVIWAIDAAIQTKSALNIGVINLSLGRPVFESYTLDPLCQAVEAAWKAGIVVVVAAGNSGRYTPTQGYGTITAPGNDPYVITVGAMKTMGTAAKGDDLIASYSSKGPTPIDHLAKPDLVAPGNEIVAGACFITDCSLPAQYPQNFVPVSWYTTSQSGTSWHYMQMSGTSMAAPFVAGAAALMLQKNPNLTPDLIKARLMKTASKNFPASSVATDPATGLTYTSYYDLFTVGAGYLNITAALASNDSAAGAAMSPRATLVGGKPVLGLTTMGGQNVIWGSGATFASNVIWGSNAVSGSAVIWGSNVIWGSSSTTGYNVIWGSTGLASTSSPNTATAMMRGE